MVERLCPGLPADWLNAWLASLGAITLVPELKLRWSDDPVPLAVLVAPGDAEPLDLLTAAWPTAEQIASLPIARHLDGLSELTLNPDVDAWAERAVLARSHPQGWTLSSMFTDLAWDRQARRHVIDRGQFYTGAAAGRTIDSRLTRVVDAVGPGDVAQSLEGNPCRIQANGLGFDLTRIASSSDSTEMFVDPVVEVLAFSALRLFPTRTDGRHPARQRCWSRSDDTKRDELCWLTWHAALGADAVDALLDLNPWKASASTGITSVWSHVPWTPSEKKDPTRGFGSRRVEGPWDRK